MPEPIQIVLVGLRGLVFLRPGPDMCDFCGSLIGIGDWPSCGGDPSKHGPVISRAHIFPSFEFEGRVIDSLQAANRVERDSEQAYRNGEGAPVRFRAFHQDASNYDKHTFGPSPQVPTPKRQNIRPGFGKQARDREVHPAVRRIRGD